MNTLIPTLIALAESLEPAPNAPASALRDTLRVIAAVEIQQDPSQADIPPGDLDPQVVEAIQAGAEQVAALQKRSATLRISSEILPLGILAAQAGEQVSETLGPFADPNARLGCFLTFESGAFLRVLIRLPQANNLTQLILLIPAGSTPDSPDFSSWTLAPGSVWIESRFLVAGATGFTGLRIASGTLRLAAGTIFQGTTILAPFLTPWSLSVVPEPAPPPGAGSDAEALALTLPTRLDVDATAAPRISGAPVLSGFGSDLHFTFSGSPFFEGTQIVFPMLAVEPTWTITGNVSALAAFSGESRVASANFALPVSTTPDASLAEAPHGGSLVVFVEGGLTCTFAAQQGGPSDWFVSNLTANAQRVELVGLQSDSAARYDFDFWNTSSSSLQFAGRPIVRLLFRSERGAIDTAAIFGGAISDKWDLPCDAAGQPFPFEGVIDSFGLLSNPSGTWVTVAATAPPPVPDPLRGLALENLYLVLKAPRKLFFISPFDTQPLLESGVAILNFDVNLIVPTLPDPYATNLPLAPAQGGAVPPVAGVAANAFGVLFRWANATTPRMRTYLQISVPLLQPSPNEPSDIDERILRDAFHTHLGVQQELIYLLDMSSGEHLLGVALESGATPNLKDNRLVYPLAALRLLMMPQSLWEPVLAEPDPLIPPPAGSSVPQFLHSDAQSGPTLVGANSVALVPAMPKPVTGAIFDAIHLQQPGAALFSLPFGMRAMTVLSPNDPAAVFLPIPDAITELHEPAFDEFTAARQFRITARNNPAPIPPDAFRSVPGMMRQLANFNPLVNSFKLTSVTPSELRDQLNNQFAAFVPLQHADLSGYGLSTFSQWALRTDDPGFIKAEFQVLNGRTAYEVLQFRSVLYECGARVVRTVIMERHNSGRVIRSDTGWVAAEPGMFTRPVNFEKGAVQSFQNIRRIRIVGAPFAPVMGGATVQPVIFDADAVIFEHAGGPVPIYDRPGYIEVQTSPGAHPGSSLTLSAAELKALFDKVGPIGSPVDCVVRLGKTLEMQLSAIVSDVALDDAGQIGFVVGVTGSPKLPRAGQWNAMRIDPATGEVSTVDPRRGVPVVRVGFGPYRFREPSDARLTTPRVQHGLLLSTESSRVLFPQPFISLALPGGKLEFDLPPVMADPYSLVHSTSHFPRPGFAQGLKENALFHISDDNQWRIDAPDFNFGPPLIAGLMKGGDWGISRGWDPVIPDPLDPTRPPIHLNIDSAAPVALKIALPTSHLNLDLPSPLNSILKIHTNYETVAGGLPKLATPTLEFSGALQQLKEILDSLSQLIGLPFDFHVSVTAGGGDSPSFVVHMNLNFRIGAGPEDRIDIGMGKFYGEFNVLGELEAALTGVKRTLLSLEFQGDIQQGILPPLLYAGGLFRFSIELQDTGSPAIEMSLGVIFSIGGDLIPGLIDIEATVHYGYTLNPETLDPGALIGIDAHAKLLGGLVGFSFGVEAMARVARFTLTNPQTVTIWAHIRVAASVHIAIFLDEDIDFETQFQQDLPLATVALLSSGGVLAGLAVL